MSKLILHIYFHSMILISFKYYCYINASEFIFFLSSLIVLNSAHEQVFLIHLLFLFVILLFEAVHYQEQY